MSTNIAKGISFSWDIHYACNYRCPYCWWHGRWQQLVKFNRYLSVAELTKYWSNIYRKYGSVQIEMLGGEPFLYPDFKNLIKELSQMHTLRITTNLSTDIDDFSEQVNPKTVEITCSFHPLFADLDSFIKKTILLRTRNFRFAVTYLGYPPQIKSLEFYRNKFTHEGIIFNVLTFWGKYGSREYPAAYTEEEKKILNPHLAQCGGESFQLLPIQSPQGKLCYAGSLHACIHPDGEVIRCGGGGYGGVSEIVGNFFDENFKLLDGPKPCLSDCCPCNEWAFLLEDIIKEKQDTEIVSQRQEAKKEEREIITVRNAEADRKNLEPKEEKKELSILDSLKDGTREETGDLLMSSAEGSITERDADVTSCVQPPKEFRESPFVNYRVYWNWEMLFQCNYKCSYCAIGHGEIPCMPEQGQYTNVEVIRWMEVWDRIFKTYHSCIIRLSGGEPTIHPVFYELMPSLLEKHVVVLTTNLSFDVKYFIEKIRPENMCITASFHPEFIALEDFLAKAIFLRDNHFGLSVCVVSYLPFLDKLLRFKEAFEKERFIFTISPFGGKYNGREYPDSYSDAERKIMEEVTGKSEHLSHESNPTNRKWYEWKTAGTREVKDKFCRMGQMYARILPNGDVTRCCVPNTGMLGNILKEDFTLLKEPQLCEAKIKCPCFKAMLAGEENNWLPLWATIEHSKYKHEKQNGVI